MAQVSVDRFYDVIPEGGLSSGVLTGLCKKIAGYKETWLKPVTKDGYAWSCGLIFTTREGEFVILFPVGESQDHAIAVYKKVVRIGDDHISETIHTLARAIRKSASGQVPMRTAPVRIHRSA